MRAPFSSVSSVKNWADGTTGYADRQVKDFSADVAEAFAVDLCKLMAREHVEPAKSNAAGRAVIDASAEMCRALHQLARAADNYYAAVKAVGVAVTEAREARSAAPAFNVDG